MKSRLKIAIAVLGALILLYLSFQVYYILSPAYVTTVAVMYEVTDKIEAEGMVVREEMTIPKSFGVQHYLVSDGDKVAKDAVIALMYDDPMQSVNALRLQDLKEELRVLKSLSDGSRGSASPTSLKRSIYSTLTNLSGEIAGGDCSSLSDARISILSMLGSYTISSGGEIDTSIKQSEIEKEIARLELENLSANGSVTSEYSGYFVSFVDGCEDILAKDQLSELTIDEIAEKVKESHSSYKFDDRQAKILSGYSWNYVAVLPASKAQRLRVGRSYNISFSYSAAGELPAVVSSIITEDENDLAVVVFRCDRLNSDIAQLRNENITISFSNYNGIRVDKSALRILNGRLGVYINYGGTVKFRYVNAIYETDEYIVSSATEGNGEYLALYDEIIVSGKDLYVDKTLS